MKKYELLREGELTTDGRYIEVGAISLSTDSLPLLAYPTEDGDSLPNIVGYVTNIHREGSRIYGDADIDVEAVTVDVDQSAIKEENEQLIFTAGRIVACFVSTKAGYPWKDDE